MKGGAAAVWRYGWRRLARAALFLLAVAVLTLATQIGGLVLCLVVAAGPRVGRRLARRGALVRFAALPAIFIVAYGAVSLAAVPVAGMAGRVPLPCLFAGESAYKPLTVWTCLLNRHYTTPAARNALDSAARRLSAGFPGRRIAYLDAGFPLFDWFPILPHLSHRDGRKVDVALLFVDPGTGRPAPGRAPSPIGYWGYVQPPPGAFLPCAGQASPLRWDLDWLQPLLPALRLDEAGMAAFLKDMAASPAVARIFVEPHIPKRLGIEHPRLRFQGCAAARHDDHIHIAFR